MGGTARRDPLHVRQARHSGSGEKQTRLGVAAQYESEVIYNSIQKDLEEQGVIFVDTDTAVQKYPELVKKYFGKCIPSNDNKFSALNTAAWSGGSFVYVPKGVHVDIPLQAYFPHQHAEHGTVRTHADHR